MTHMDKVQKYIYSSHEYLCDDCLSELLDIKSRQTVNKIANKLFVNNSIKRRKDSCSNCKKEKFINERL